MTACAAAIAPAQAIDYWTGDLADDQAVAVEEHVFACDACARRVETVAELAAGVAAATRRRGGLEVPVTASLIARLEREGVRVRHYRLRPGEQVACTVGPDDDLLVSWLAIDPTGVERVDVTLCDAAGQPYQRVDDVPFDRATGEVGYANAGDTARTWPATTFRARTLAVSADGERVLGEYVFEHTPPAP